jgi:hypothetical protein
MLSIKFYPNIIPFYYLVAAYVTLLQLRYTVADVRVEVPREVDGGKGERWPVPVLSLNFIYFI